MRKPNRHLQGGFTLVEVVIAMLVTSVILSGAASVIYQILVNNSLGSAHVKAVKQVENALHFIVRDLQMAQQIEIDGLAPGEILRLQWVDWDTSETSSVTYMMSDDTVVRRYSAGDGTIVARYVAVLSPEKNVCGDIAVTMKCTVPAWGGRRAEEIRTLRVKPRTGT